MRFLPRPVGHSSLIKESEEQEGFSYEDKPPDSVRLVAPMKVDAEASDAAAPAVATAVPGVTEAPSSLDGGEVPADIPSPERALLARLEEENKKIEADSKAASLTQTSSSSSRCNSLVNTHNITEELASDHGEVSSTSEEPAADPSFTNKEEEWAYWNGVLSNWEEENRRRLPFLRQKIREGIPQPFRGLVWQYLAEANKSENKKLYASLIKATSACEKVIRRDIARTYPEHDFFKEKDGLGQESLFNVMKAYSVHDREVGYCQGSGFIVGLLLMQMPEEEAFAVLVRIMQHHRMRDMFKPSMAELGLCMFQLENLVQEMLPELHAHFQTQCFRTTIYGSSWFLTLFTTTLSLPLACRVMDVFLSEGIEIVFKVSLALLTLGKNDLLALDMDNLLKYIQKELPLKADADHDAFMNLAYSIKVNPKKMKKLEKEYTTIKTKEQGDIAAMRCLKQENKLLKQRVELLERESTGLADRLVRGQVDSAEGKEQTFAMERELQWMRRAHMDLQQRLAVAQDEIRSLELTIAENNLQPMRAEDADQLSADELARCLQRELVRARLHAAERDAAERELVARVAELESENAGLRRQRVDNNVAHLQEELIAVRMREVEANLSLKDLGHRVEELSEAWNKYLMDQKQSGESAASTSTVVSDIMATPKKLFRGFRSDSQRLEEELMSFRIREMQNGVKLKELQLKEMELSTQIKVLTNQLRRQDEETKELREQLDTAQQRERVLVSQNKELTHKLADLETQAKDDSIMANIKMIEDSQRIAELESLISEYKLKHEVLATEGELRSNNIMDDTERVRDLQEQVAELTAEIQRLEAWRARGRPISRTESLEEDIVHSEDFRLVIRRESGASLTSRPNNSTS